MILDLSPPLDQASEGTSPNSFIHLTPSPPCSPLPLGESSELRWRHLVKASVKWSSCCRNKFLGLRDWLWVTNHLFQWSPLGLPGCPPVLHPGQYVPLCCYVGSNTGGRAVEKAAQVSRRIQTVSEAEKLGEQRRKKECSFSVPTRT